MLEKLVTFLENCIRTVRYNYKVLCERWKALDPHEKIVLGAYAVVVSAFVLGGAVEFLLPPLGRSLYAFLLP